MDIIWQMPWLAAAGSDIIMSGDNVKIKDATVYRIKSICKERKITLYKVGILAGVNPKTIYSLIRPERQDMSLVLLKKIVDGLEMSMSEFFDAKVFDETELEIE